jgi:hypothetical protein
VEVLKYGEIMNGFQSSTINLARVRSYIKAFRSAYPSFYGKWYWSAPRAPVEELDDARKTVFLSVSPTGKVAKPTLSDPANTRVVDFFANQYFYDDSQDAMNPAWAQLRTQTFGDQSVLEVLRPLKSQADLEKYFRVAINCWENVLDYTDLVPITDRLDRQH